tara:strand:+ start:43 stop:330 length:288 start_codon:yes stop_codon:yes gene_type:complete
MTWSFLLFLALAIGILILFASQNDWDWYWNNYKQRQMVNLFGKKIARIISSFFGVVIVFYSILGLKENFNSKSEIRYRNIEPTQRMEYLKKQNNK